VLASPVFLHVVLHVCQTKSHEGFLSVAAHAVPAQILLPDHLSDAAVNSEGKQQTVAELHRGSRVRQQAAKAEMQHLLIAVAMLTKKTMRRLIQGKGCVSYASKTEAIWCFKHVVICARATSALLILTGVPSVEPEPEPSECTMLECSVPVLCAEVCGVDLPSQMAVYVLCFCYFCYFENVLLRQLKPSFSAGSCFLSLVVRGLSLRILIVRSTIDLLHQ